MAESPAAREKVQALLESALRLNAAERASFLDRACAGNITLRQEVESLLANHEDADKQPRSRDSRSEDFSEMIGRTIAHYKIIAFLGRGGMGEVYLAQDSRLGRKVALKLLPASLSNDEDRLRRFEREARSASALNHPNVCVIYEVGETGEGQPFIAMEYIDGVTLRRRFGRDPLRLSEAIEIALQIAFALDAAHQAGVVHRDVKPENAMVRDDGYVKVLDFGLAKLTERYALESDSEAPTFHVFSTHSGLLIGTVNYLSPEQARRHDVDERTDIWSLGVVLYEMIAGCLPFTGETPSHTIVAILEREPVPLAQLVTRLPGEMDWIVKKALRKDREQRYQTIKELIGDLTEVKQKIVDGLEPPPSRLTSTQSVHSTFESISQTLRQPRISLGFFVLALIVLGLGTWAVFQWLKTPARPFQNVRLSKLTYTGSSVHNGAAVSPDGKYVAYVAEDGGRQSLVVNYQPTTSTVVIVPPTEGRYNGLTFSSDGNYIYYVRRDKTDPPLLYQVPVLGGISQKISSNVTSPISFSDDGKRFAFIRFDELKGDYSLIVAKADGSDERTLATRSNPSVFSVNGLDWSPDGKMIAVLDGGYDNGFHMRVVGVNVLDGGQKTISTREWFSVLQVKWVKDGSGLIVNAADESVSPVQIWYLPYPAGVATKITNDASDYYGVSLTANAANLVTIQSNLLKKVWVSPKPDANQAVEIATGVGHSYGIAWATDGRIIYSTMASGRLDLWSLRSDGTEKKQLTANAGANYHPVVSPDGKYIFFASNRTGAFNIWRIDVDGNNPKQLTSGGSDFYPYPSPDGLWVVYQSGGGQNGRPSLWKVSVEGGEPSQITSLNTSVPVVSPDGSMIACRFRDESNSTQKIAIIPFVGGPPLRILDIPIVDWQRIRWSPEGASLTFIDTRGGVSNLWKQVLDGSQPKQLTDFKSDQIFSYDLSRDGKLACERGIETSDVVLVSSSQ
jgi:eukaryotic-like serine/threonine-protein kinase